MTGDRSWWETGFSADDEAQWSIVVPKLIDAYDFTPEATDLIRVASRWRIAGFTADEALEWREALADDPDWEFLAQTAREWRDADFSPRDASHWAAGLPMPGESAEYAALFRDAGWHPFDVWLLYSFCTDRYQGDWNGTRRAWAQVPPRHALNCARAGMSSQEALEYLDWEEADLAAELRRRYALRVPVDPFVAMHVNHHIWLSYGTEVPDDAPFYAEHLWDLNDQAEEERERARRAPKASRPVEPTGRTATPPVAGRQRVICPGSGGNGQMEERDGWDEWHVVCPECAGKWAGGPVSPLPEHTR